MATYNVNNVHNDAALTNVAIDYVQNQGKFVVDQIFPVVRVNKESDKYYVWSAADTFRIETKLVPDGASFPRKNRGLTTATYSCEEYGLEGQLTDRTRANADMNIESTIVSNTMGDVLSHKEKIFADEWFTTGKWDTNATFTATTKWNGTGPDPISDFDTAIDTLANYGVAPEDMVVILGRNPWNSLKRNSDLVGLFGGGDPRVKNVTTEFIRQYFGFKKFIIGTAVYNTAKEGQTISQGNIWGNHCLILAVPNTASVDIPSAGYQFQVSAANVERYREDRSKSDIFRCSSNYDFCQTASNLGYMMYQVYA